MATQRTLVKEMIPWVQKMVGDSGVCATNPAGRLLTIQHIDLACDQLMKRLDSEGMMFNWYIPVCDHCIALPQDCREARQIVLNGVPLIQRDQWYLGKICNGYHGVGCGPAECLDLGDFYIPHPLPKQRGIRIALVALNNADANKVCVVEVVNEYGQRVKEEILLMENQQPWVMDSVAYDVTFFLKPKTLGPVALQLAYDDEHRTQWCEYLPHTEEGLFRRKSIPQRSWGCNIARVVGKLRYDRITDENQIMPINDRVGMGYAVAAISAWNRGDTQAYNENMLLALNEIKKQMEDGDSAGNVRQVKFRTDFANSSQAGGGRCWS